MVLRLVRYECRAVREYREHLLIEYVIQIAERLRLILLILHAFPACKSVLWLLILGFTGHHPSLTLSGGAVPAPTAGSVTGLLLDRGGISNAPPVA